MLLREGITIDDAHLAALCARHGVKEILLFGSSARGEARPDSDIDLLVTFLPEARVGFLEMAALQEELSEALGRPVDLAPKEGLKVWIRDEILSEAKPVYLAA